MTLFKMIAAGCALGALAACGGGSTGNGGGKSPNEPAPESAFDRLNEEVANADFFAFGGGTRFNDLPDSGAAEFAGVAAYRDGDATYSDEVWEGGNADMISRFALGVDFETGIVNGGATEFFDTRTGRALPGELVLRGDIADRDQVIRGGVAGRMAERDGTPTEAGGRFYGNFHNGTRNAAGRLDIQTPNGSWDGVFTTERR